MPTGYVSEIYDNKPITFEKFVLRCARAFGACIEQRDDSMEVKPSLRKASDYHEKSLKSAEETLKKLRKSKKSELKTEFEKYKKTRIEETNNYLFRKDLENRYKKMINSVEGWIPPTEEHKGLQDFMISQLNDSIKYDCNLDYYKEDLKGVENLNFEKWLNSRIEGEERKIIYHKEEYEKELKSIEKSNDWIIKLYESLNLNPPK